MFEPTSRYFSLRDLVLKTPDGKQITYKERRFLPALDDVRPAFQEIAISAGDRLDLIAFRTLGDPEQFWRICDSKDMIHRPEELTSEPGRVIRIPVAGG